MVPLDAADAASHAQVLVLHPSAAWGAHQHAPLFTYMVPAALQDVIVPGHAVLVPFGARLVSGVVWQIQAGQTHNKQQDRAWSAPRGAEPPRSKNEPLRAGDESDQHEIASSKGVADETIPEVRAISELLDPIPLLDAAHLALAAWLAEAYVCSLVEAVRMIAPGMTTQPRIDLVGTMRDAAGPASGDPQARALLGLLDGDGQADEAVVRRALGTRRAGALIAALEAEGALSRIQHIKPDHATTPDLILRLIAEDQAVASWRSDALAKLTSTMPAPVRRKRPANSAERTRRSRGALLQRIATADAAPLPSAPLATRELVRLRAAVAMVDLLQSTPEQARTQREVLRLTRATPAALAVLLDAGLVTKEASVTTATSALAPEAPLPLTPPQASAVDHILAALDAAAELAAYPPHAAPPDEATLGAARPILLHGITGSGKTEVYLQALAAAIERGRRGIVLVPEIALTPQTVSRFAARFPGRVALLHSGLQSAERQREWRRIRAGAVDVVIGSRSAIFAPIPDLGLIILDEEHDASYKHDNRPPTYHAREVAFTLARLVGAAVVLGSATPATESMYHARHGDYALLELRERPTGQDAQAADDDRRETDRRDQPQEKDGRDQSRPYTDGATGVMNAAPTPIPAPLISPSPSPMGRGPRGGANLPPVSIIDLREELHAGQTSILSRALLAGIEETLARGEQTILFLNRRGSATCVLCRDCGYVARCGRCDVPLTHHQHVDYLICHYCGWQETPPRICLRCGGLAIRYFGIGTERMEATVRERFPRARVLRWDADTVQDYQDHERFGRALAERQVDILIGTQMIAKGLDVPSVTLVGIVAADIALFLPDYRAPERAFQLLTQVAGRAGRGLAPGRVILQTFSPGHFCIEAAARHDYQAFYEVEIATRQSYGYPPFRRFIKLTYTHKDRHACQLEAISLGDHLTRLIDDLALPATDIVGPAPAFIERLRNQYRWQMILRGPDPRAVIAALAPGELGPGWTIDIDPTSSL